MNKLAILCLLGLASAHQRPDTQHRQKMLGVFDQIFVEEENHTCKASDAGKIKDWKHYGLILASATYREGVRGLYQERSSVISDQCLGDWLIQDYLPIKPTFVKLREDMWSVSLAEAKTVVDTFVNMWFKNAEVCQFERLTDDLKNWCLENPEECIFKAGIEQHFFNNVAQISGKLFDLYKLMVRDDSCYTDREQINEIAALVADMTEIYAYLSGFDYKWDQSVERKHIRRKDFKKQLHEEIAKIPHSWDDILYGAMPNAYEAVQSILEMINQFFEEFEQQMQETVNSVDETVTQMFTPQTFIPEGFYGYPMPEATQETQPQDIVFTFEKMIQDNVPQIDMPQFDVPQMDMNQFNFMQIPQIQLADLKLF